MQEIKSLVESAAIEAEVDRFMEEYSDLEVPPAWQNTRRDYHVYLAREGRLVKGNKAWEGVRRRADEAKLAEVLEKPVELADVAEKVCAATREPEKD